MQACTLQTWIARRIALRQRLARVCTSYLLFLMVVTQKHSLEEAARFVLGMEEEKAGEVMVAADID